MIKFKYKIRRAMDNCVAYGMVFLHSEKTEHQANEYITLDDLRNATRLYNFFI